MGWKSWPGWLKGGIIAISIYLIYSAITLQLISSEIISDESVTAYILMYPQVPGFIIGIALGLIKFSFGSGNGNMSIPIIINSILYFLIGMLISWHNQKKQIKSQEN